MSPKFRYSSPAVAAVDWQARMRAAFIDAINEADIVDIVNAIKAKAKDGDLASGKVIFAYALGVATAPLPLLPPTEELPKTEGKIIALQARAERGAPVFHCLDASHGDENGSVSTNGHYD